MVKKYITIAIVGIFAASAIATAAFWYSTKQLRGSEAFWQNEVKITDAYAKFLSEIIDTVQQNYWKKITEAQLAEIYVSGINRLTGQNIVGLPTDKKERLELLENILDKIDAGQKKDFCASLADYLMANLAPAGRSRLYGQKDTKALENRVNNRDENVDLYNVMGVEKQASLARLYEIYQEKLKQVDESSPDAKQKKELLDRAYATLSNDNARANYDKTGSETTVSAKLTTPEILYLRIKMFSPNTYEELKTTIASFDRDKSPDTLIIDLRDNVGGNIDGLPQILGAFIGNGQHGYQFLHQEEKPDFLTTTGELSGLARYKKIVILVNGGTQSTAEVLAASLKKYNAGILVGENTKGWGTVERVFPIQSQIARDENYSLFLVHSLTLREDNQPIEGQGVAPAVNINDRDWEGQLYGYFRYPELAQAIKEIWNQ